MKILVVGVARSGTSFLGELFRQNHDIPYLYEPFWGRTFFVERQWCWLTEQDAEPDGRRLLQEVFDGRFDELARQQPTPQHADRYSCRRQELEAQLRRHGSPAGEDLAIKEIRLNMHLRWAVEVLGPDVRVIHLVRDPRGVVGSFLFSSRTPWPPVRTLLTDPVTAWRSLRVPDDTLYREWTGWFESRPLRRLSPAFAACERHFDRGAPHRRIAARWAALTGQALADAQHLPARQYTRVRYEDLCQRPVEEAARLHAFLGRPLPKAVEAWLTANTRGGDRRDRYGTSRNSMEMVDAWKTQLTRRQRREVEALCGSVMTQLDYDDA